MAYMQGLDKVDSVDFDDLSNGTVGLLLIDKYIAGIRSAWTDEV